MLPSQFLDIFILLLVMLNPFLMGIYLIDLIKSLSVSRFSHVIVRAFVISCIIFIVFGLTGDYLFKSVLHIHFGSFLIFGGLLFAIISIQQLLHGPKAITMLRGPVDHIGGAVTLPFMLGPGTISTSIYAGSELSLYWTIIVIVSALTCAAISLICLKMLFNWVSTRYTEFTESYIDVTGRIMALLMGSIAVNMIIKGIHSIFFIS
jgi:multiple antibiotic resistance protein